MFREIRTSEKITDNTANISIDDLDEIININDLNDPSYKYWAVTDDTFDIDRPIWDYERAFAIREKQPADPYVVISGPYDTYEEAEAAAEDYNAKL